MKDHVQVRRSVYIEGVVELVVKEIQEAAQGLKQAEIENDSWGGDPSYVVVGWRPMTEQELERQKVRRQRDKEASDRRKEAAEKKEKELLTKLARKYPDTAIYLIKSRRGA